MQTVVYTTPFNINNLQIPTRVQVHYARLYADRHSLRFCLPVSESLIDSPTAALSRIIQSPTATNIIVFSRLFVALPTILSVVETTGSACGLSHTYHFSYEDIRMSTLQLKDYISMVTRYQAYAKVM
jgi:sporadic carbohydrate cluster protein (TIGR04323 family)